MKQHRPTPTPLQPLTPADLAYIRDLATAHSEGLEARCAKYRRRADIRRTVVAACLLVGCCTAYSSLMAAPQYDYIATLSDVTPQHICDVIRTTIESL